MTTESPDRPPIDPRDDMSSELELEVINLEAAAIDARSPDAAAEVEELIDAADEEPSTG